MALKIIPANDVMPVKTLTICLYAPPGLGKTSTAFTAKNPLLLDFDQGSHRSQYRKDTVSIEKWEDVADLLTDDLSHYDTIVVDTAGRAIDLLTVFLMRDDPKLKNKNGQLSLQGFGVLKNRFNTWMRSISALGKDIILLAHMTEDKNNEELIERLDIVGSSKNEICKTSDVIGRIRINSQKERIIDFDPSSTGFGKNPAQLSEIKVPHFSKSPDFFSEILDEIKNTLNQKNAFILQEEKRISSLRDFLNSLENPHDFNAQIMQMKNAKPVDKALLIDIAKSKGFLFNKEKSLFEEVKHDPNISN